MTLFFTEIMVFLLGCATTVIPTPAGIRNDMGAVIRDVSVNRGALDGLKKRRIGKSGFYYVIDLDGKVVFHPQLALIGTSFSKIWFIDQLVAEKSGCLTYQLGNRSYHIFFEPLNDSEILCFSIISDELNQPAGCKAAQVR